MEENIAPSAPGSGTRFLDDSGARCRCPWRRFLLPGATIHSQAISLPELLAEKLCRDPHELVLRDDADELPVLHDGKASDTVMPHQLDGGEGFSLGGDRDEVARHDGGDGKRDAVLLVGGAREGSQNTPV